MTIRERWQRICAGKSGANNTETDSDRGLTALAAAMLSPTNTYPPGHHRHALRNDPNRRILSHKSSNRSFLPKKLPWRSNNNTDNHEDTISRQDMEPTSHPRPQRYHETATRKKPTENPKPPTSKRSSSRKHDHDQGQHSHDTSKENKNIGSIRRRNNLKDKGTRKRKNPRQRQREREKEIDKFIFTPNQQHHQEMLRSYTFPFVERGEEGGGYQHRRRKSSNVSPYSSRPGSLSLGGEDLGRGIGGLSLGE